MKNICINEKIDEFMKAHLTEKRIRHVYAVRDTAVHLSKLYGEDPKKAEIAALCHDLFKCFDKNTANEYVKKYNLDDKYIDNIDLSHSKIAAAFAKEDLKIDDQDILNAISFHTTGRANMSRLEKIIYLADAIEPNRTYEEVDYIRKMSEIDLDRAVILTLSGSIKMLERLKKPIDSDTIKALDFMQR
ncbi:MAG: bis(5'-nucleosyl)-tetraphosphatase (symmetrical) YqeK [Eubacteriales bacterium]